MRSAEQIVDFTDYKDRAGQSQTKKEFQDNEEEGGRAEDFGRNDGRLFKANCQVRFAREAPPSLGTARAHHVL